MTERETTRLLAWSTELRRVHQRIREALRVTQEAVSAGHPSERAGRDLLLYCHGFCAALDGHHRGEDRTLFPAIEQAHPQLAPVLRALEGDHAVIAGLLGELRAAVDRSAPAEELDRHLEGVAAIMENHFRYEERRLLEVLETLELHAAVGEVFGPL
ncbi:hemerythrin domain-containing protein [Actinopolymorpha singaporensis]|uniref:Hemerythrin HHE cation binding domain-containing protein n=1 Tax=Actinopolymorpha singaporensis TaxID=117157 RepID=A0A1H1T041_9ACTN|nr:hemerythrin domain-containing protein [Actinopolymorpha singaporensis]SDS53453.1 Hemerythrin HHE cation binding domain-containing protein [Actinopolymorpha singaporensis]